LNGSKEYLQVLILFLQNSFGWLDNNPNLQMKDLSPVKKQLTLLVSGFLAGAFGTCFNCPGDVIRTAIQKRELADLSSSSLIRPKFSAGYVWSAVTDFIQTGSQIIKTKGIKGLYYGFGFKAMHLGGSGALLTVFIPMFTTMFGFDKK
jgi:hypothetical protein